MTARSRLSFATIASRFVLASIVVPFAAIPAMSRAADETPQPIAGIGPTGPLVEVQGEFKFTEGPAADHRGVVFFSDVPNAKVYKVGPNNRATLFRDNSNNTNGQMFNGAGELLSCESKAGRIVAVAPDGMSVRVLADKFKGKRFHAPNDLCVDRKGGVYFTDPHFGVALADDEFQVYYIAADGTVSGLLRDLHYPNGVILSPDEKTLYVIPTGQAEMMAYPVESPGKLGKGRVFCRLQQTPTQKNGGGDGLSIDSKGNLYIASVAGVQVFGPQGKLLGVLKMPINPANSQPIVPSNCTFGGPDSKTLYITARTRVFALPMEARGWRFGGK
jgi:gluconolactonase